MKLIAGAGAALVAFVLAVASVAVAPGTGVGAPSAKALEEIPASLLPVYMNAATTCPGLPWQVLAAIGFIESGHGSSRLDPLTGQVTPPILGPALDGTGGVARVPDRTMPDGWAHALGPMQFLSTNWSSWGRSAPGRPIGAAPDVHNAWDAIYTAAAYLCGGAQEISDLDAAILRYNRSYAYLDAVMDKAIEYELGMAVGVGGLFCPVAGEVDFTNDWGYPRSGGRTHKGTDMFARAGTPLVAVESGEIDRVTNADVGLGGITIWLKGDSGTRYYYAHNSLNAASVGQRVQGGQVIAYVGNTGNAASTPPHVHFEVHPGGGSAVNPYAVVSSLCGKL